MQKKYYKIITSLVLSLCLCLPCCLSAAAQGETPQGWYCVRAKDHRQPRADAALSFVESYGGYYIDHRHTASDAEDKVVYLTFDAGYENGNVERVLDTLNICYYLRGGDPYLTRQDWQVYMNFVAKTREKKNDL